MTAVECNIRLVCNFIIYTHFQARNTARQCCSKITEFIIYMYIYIEISAEVTKEAKRVSNLLKISQQKVYYIYTDNCLSLFKLLESGN